MSPRPTDEHRVAVLGTEMATLTEAMADLHEKLAKLTDRLEEVLSPAQPQADCQKDPVATKGSPLLEKLAEQRRSVVAAGAKIDELLQRCEL